MKENKIHILSTAPLDRMPPDPSISKEIVLETLSFIEIGFMGGPELEKKIRGFSERQMRVIFTSVNAVEAVKHLLDGQKTTWKIYCIEGTTHKMVADFFGMASVVKTARDASSLANAIIGDKVRELLFFCGTLRREELSIQLAESGILLVELPVYRTTLTPQVTGKNYAGILFFSPSAVESFFSLNKVLDETILFAIGPTTAAAIRKFSANKIVTGELPGKELLLQQSIRYFLAGNHRKA